MGDGMGPLQGTLELVVLRTLDRGGEMHGFGILDWITTQTREALQVEDGALYHALHRMADRGWLERDWGVSEKGRRARYYRLTPQGREALTREEERWAQYVQAMGRLASGEVG
jgi:transcriptional regulator